jgi:YfiH family protein
VIVRTVGGARVVFTDRHGGVSRGRFESANLADHVGDDPGAVARNRVLVARRTGLTDPGAWVGLHQVHGNVVECVDAPPGTVPDADASVTTVVGLPLLILTADCAPIAIVGDGAVAAVHAGWAGLEAGVIERAVGALRATAPGPYRAVLGPCIHPSHYEFGAELLDRLVARFGDRVAARTARGQPALDVPAAVRVALRRAGVDELDDVGVCTAASPDHFSYRRDGETGRQAMLVVRER